MLSIALRLVLMGKSALSAITGFARNYPWQLALIVSLCIAGWQWRGKQQALAQLAAMEAAQVTATENQIAVNHAPAVKSQAIAERSNADAPEYYARGRAAGLAYANAHRVRSEACSPVNPGLPGTDSPAPVNDGPGEVADMVALSRADFDTLTGNSLRLAKVQQDSQALIDAGVAIPAVEFGQ
jgi:hypothetical protein